MRANPIIAALILAAALLMPAAATDYHLKFLLELFMMIVLAQSWNLISGMTGYVSFGHAAFFGVGAYTGALLLIAGVHWILAILAGAGMAFLVALPLGVLTLRLRGPYFAIAMLGLNEVGRIVATLWVDLTEGGDGISLLPDLLPSLMQNYYAMLALAVLTTGLIAYIYRSRFGLELRAIRDDEGAAEMVGVNTTRNKVLAFTASAVFPGAAGVVYAMDVAYIDPASLFNPALNIQMIVMVLLGGSGTLWGPVIGAGIIMLLKEIFWANFPAIHLGLLGILLIFTVLYLPRGILSMAERRKRARPDQAEERIS
ncbi:MAG: branched-chain amino acid ABC transporter permease [Gammaproteobacteria bacterium]|nr:branched-chain amino acid ABC transporter permease [Gammaproteobacteria bacterium]